MTSLFGVAPIRFESCRNSVDKVVRRGEGVVGVVTVRVVGDVAPHFEDTSMVDMDKVGFFKMDAPRTDIEPARGREGLVISALLGGLCTEVGDLGPVDVESGVRVGECFGGVLGAMPKDKQLWVRIKDEIIFGPHHYT